MKIQLIIDAENQSDISQMANILTTLSNSEVNNLPAVIKDAKVPAKIAKIEPPEKVPDAAPPSVLAKLATTDSTVTREAVRAAVKASNLAATVNKPLNVALLAEFGVTAVSDLKEDDLSAFLDKLNARG